MSVITNSDQKMELITTELANIAKYRLGKIKSKQLIIYIILDSMHGSQSLAYLAQTSRSFRNILLEAPHLIKQRLIKKLKPIITCKQHSLFGLQKIITPSPCLASVSDESLATLFKFSKRELCVTADSLKRLKFIQSLTEQKQSIPVRCLTIPGDRPFSWLDKEYHNLLRLIQPKELNIFLNGNSYLQQEPLDLKAIIPPSVKILRLNIFSGWRDANDIDPSNVLMVDYLCIKCEEPFHLRYLINKVRPSKMLILELPDKFNKLFINSIVKEDMLKGIPELVISLDEKTALTSTLMNEFEKIDVPQKCLLAWKFSKKNYLQKYLDLNQARLEKLFEKNSSFNTFIGDYFERFSFTWESSQGQLRDYMKLSYPSKKIEVLTTNDKTYDDYFKVNIIQRQGINPNPEFANLIDLADDPFTRSLTISSTFDNKGIIGQQIVYFLHKCSKLERLTLKLNHFHISYQNKWLEFDVKKVLQGTSKHLRKLDVQVNGDDIMRRTDEAEKQVLDILVNNVKNAKDTLDTIKIRILTKTSYKKYGTMFEVSQQLIRQLTPHYNKLKKVSLRADQLDKYLTDLLQNEWHFPYLKSVSLICEYIQNENISFLVDLATKNRRPKRPITKLSLLQLTNHFELNDNITTRALAKTHSGIQYLKVSKMSRPMQDWIMVLSGGEKPAGFTFELAQSFNLTSQDCADLIKMFPQFCIIL
ncbi:hypothetical protein FGO68_gene10978 [Halteria grandinella]|uniref:Uncharacterized protein n=1 Tax=Halteria grandinella TaxID=5974 RepID=A0A8J8NUG4_HALGN|nr:hypothetical protein FGO68_gene10978 [Halteria grandinella]